MLCERDRAGNMGCQSGSALSVLVLDEGDEASCAIVRRRVCERVVRVREWVW